MPDSIKPEIPFIWPEPIVLADIRSYESEVAFEGVVQQAESLLGIVASLSSLGIDCLERWLTDNAELQATLIVAVYPTCSTKQTDIERVKELVRRCHDRLQIRIRPYNQVTDRPTNALCFHDSALGATDIVTGSSENFGFDPSPTGKINFVFHADPALVESFQRHFTWLWVESQDIRAEGLPDIPELVLPKGSVEAQQRWETFSDAWRHDAPIETAQINLETGEVILISEDNIPIASPGEEIGLPQFDPLADFVARLYPKGSLVTIDKLSRIRPLDTSVDPAIFGEVAELQRGSVKRKVEMRVSIIDDKTLREIENRRKAPRTLLNKFSFKLADNIRWMPHPARALFESEVERINREGQNLITDLLKGDVDAFIKGKRDALVTDLNAMSRELGRQGPVPQEAIEKVEKSLKERLIKAQTANFMPALTYSPIQFSTQSNTWANPWGQAYALLSDIAAFPRQSLTNSRFFQGFRVSEDELVEAMNVADDALLRDQGLLGIRERSRSELELIARIETSPIESKDRCKLIWEVIKGSDPKTLAEKLEGLKQ